MILSFSFSFWQWFFFCFFLFFFVIVVALIPFAFVLSWSKGPFLWTQNLCDLGKQLANAQVQMSICTFFFSWLVKLALVIFLSKREKSKSQLSGNHWPYTPTHNGVQISYFSWPSKNKIENEKSDFFFFFLLCAILRSVSLSLFSCSLHLIYV